MPFGFLKRRPDDEGQASGAGQGEGAGRPASGAQRRGVSFEAITEDWRLAGQMDIAGRLSDALNQGEKLVIHDVRWGSPEVGAAMEPATGLQSVDPYDLILVTAGDESLPPLTDAERAALVIQKTPFQVVLEVPPYRIAGTVYLFPGTGPDRLMDRSAGMFLPVTNASATLDGVKVTDADADVLLVNRYYLRGVEQVER